MNTSKLEERSSIRTLTLRFGSRETARRFYKLCERHGYQPAYYRDENWYVLSAIFPNKAARSKLIALWAKESMIVD